MRAILAILLLTVQAAFGDVVVNTTADADVDDGACSLREAIVAVNTDASYHGCVRTAATIDTISFDLGTGTPSITVTGTDLPRMTGPTVIDGATGGATRVEIAGGGAIGTGLSFLLAANATDSAIRNLVVNGFTGRQLLISNGNGIVVEGNLIGTNAAGTALATGSGTGIEICTGFSCGTSNGHRIGGPTAPQRNVIVAGDGSAIANSGSSSNVIQGNLINTDVTGMVKLGASNARGISLANAHFNVIGGADPGEGNVIAGIIGIEIGGNPALTRCTGTVIQGNLIGVDAAGTGLLGGGAVAPGVNVGHAVTTQIGGTIAGAGNVISGYQQGIAGGSSGVSGASVDDTTVQGNLIGTDASGTVALGNSQFGVNLGDDAVIEGNLIAFNGGDGIEANCGACVQRISRNAIHSNGGIGIDLNGGGNGVSPNDADDPDTGPNHRQNFPVLDAVLFPGGTSVSGTLDSTASTTFRVEIFANDACDPSGNGEGQAFVGAKDDVTTDANGDATFTVTLDENVPAGKVLTATAIAPDGSTSEFSPCTPTPPSTTSTSTTTSTTTTAIAPTTSTSTTTAPPTTSSTSTAAATTTTPTTTNAPTTTTTAPATCGEVPDGPTFASIDCRLDALLALLAAEARLETFGPKLVHNVEKAKGRNRDAETVCGESSAKKARKRLQQAAKALTQYAHRLNGRPARRRLDDDVRQTFLDAAAPIAGDLQSLRGAVVCPEDALP